MVLLKFILPSKSISNSAYNYNIYKSALHNTSCAYPILSKQFLHSHRLHVPHSHTPGILMRRLCHLHFCMSYSHAPPTAYALSGSSSEPSCGLLYHRPRPSLRLWSSAHTTLMHPDTLTRVFIPSFSCPRLMCHQRDERHLALSTSSHAILSRRSDICTLQCSVDTKACLVGFRGIR